MKDINELTLMAAAAFRPENAPPPYWGALDKLPDGTWLDETGNRRTGTYPGDLEISQEELLGLIFSGYWVQFDQCPFSGEITALVHDLGILVPYVLKMGRRETQIQALWKIIEDKLI